MPTTVDKLSRVNEAKHLIEKGATPISLVGIDPRLSCEHQHPMCDGCLQKLGEQAGDITDV